MNGYGSPYPSVLDKIVGSPWVQIFGCIVFTLCVIVLACMARDAVARRWPRG